MMRLAIHDKDFVMLLLVLSLILMVPMALLPGLIQEIFSVDELHAMGVRLENSHN
jgi:hypothetical protein